MGRKGESRGSDLPPGRRRDLQQGLIELQREAGRVSQAEISRCTFLSKSTVSNVFSGVRVQSQDVVIRIALMLAGRLPATSGAEGEAVLDEASARFRGLWEQAKAEEDAERRGEAASGHPAERDGARHPRLPEAVRQLLFSLAVGCAVCTVTWAHLEIHRIVGLSAAMRAAEHLGGRHASLAAVARATNPWELIVLCANCNYLAAKGEIGLQELREHRLRLDRHPDAALLYGRYLDQILLSEDKEVLDLNAVASAMAIAQRGAKAGDQYVVRQGPMAYVVDRHRGAIAVMSGESDGRAERSGLDRQ